LGTDSGVPLGLFVRAQCPEETLQLQLGDLLITFSDRGSDASNEAGESFGDGRIVSWVQRVLSQGRLL
jgi:serine phosphatase RsbU (regulator of sigma subunit)